METWREAAGDLGFRERFGEELERKGEGGRSRGGGLCRFDFGVAVPNV